MSSSLRWLWVVALIAACSSKGKVDPAKDSQSPTVRPGDGDGAGAKAANAVDAAPAEPVPPPPPDGYDFIAEAKLLIRTAACSGDDPLPDHIDAKVVERHCARFAPRMAHFGDKFTPPMRAFLEPRMPKDLPPKVVYAFGGGDLISALVVYPDAPELTTISLEQSGDPRRINKLSDSRLRSSLSSMSVKIGGMLSVGSNTSVNLSSSQKNDLPVQVMSFLIGLVVHGYEPVAMYYFLLEDDGSINYLDEAEIAELDKEEALHLRSSWRTPDFSPAFANVEIQYKRTGVEDAPVQIHRHIAWNLHNDQLAARPQLIAHLEAKGPVSGMVKGASYLLWDDGFSTIRDYMLANMPFILSDSTGIPVEFASAAGFHIETFGKFNGSFLGASKVHNNAFRKLWKENPYVEMPSRFGYVDNHGKAHLMFTIKDARFCCHTRNAVLPGRNSQRRTAVLRRDSTAKSGSANANELPPSVTVYVPSVAVIAVPSEP